MKTIKKVTKIAWAIEHRKNCMLKDQSVIGFELYQTRAAASEYLQENHTPVKVRITIERAFSND